MRRIGAPSPKADEAVVKTAPAAGGEKTKKTPAKKKPTKK